MFSLSFFVVCICAPPLQADIPTEGLIGYWAFDQGQGDIAYDSVGDNHGDIYGAEWTTGQVGGALMFDGVESHVLLPSNILDASEPFSAFAWVRLDNKRGTKNQRILQQDWPCGRGLLYRNTETEKLGVFLGAEKTFSTQAIFQDTGQWYHVGVTHDSGTVKLYIDGAKDANNIVNAEPCTLGLIVGAPTNPSSTFGMWDGVIDEVVLYDRALSPEEVEQLYRAGAGEARGLIDLEIAGPDEVPDSNSAAYTAIAYYDDSSTADVTAEAIWAVDPDIFASIDAGGLLTTQQLYAPEEIVWISAEYTEDEISLEADKEVVIFANCSIEELIRRDIAGAVEIKERVLADLEVALAKEKAAQDILRDMQESRELGEWTFLQVFKARVRVLWAIIKQMWAERKIEDSKDSLEDSLEILNSEEPQPVPLPNNGRRRRTGWQRHGR